ncbi:MAG: hypothetical protein PHY92_08335 [Alphaproteobacteria bacterium]|nr:hypothetical protein [Alphaproteobacteria bacterium]
MKIYGKKIVTFAAITLATFFALNAKSFAGGHNSRPTQNNGAVITPTINLGVYLGGNITDARVNMNGIINTNLYQDNVLKGAPGIQNNYGVITPTINGYFGSEGDIKNLKLNMGAEINTVAYQTNKIKDQESRRGCDTNKPAKQENWLEVAPTINLWAEPSGKIDSLKLTMNGVVNTETGQTNLNMKRSKWKEPGCNFN